MDTWLFWSFVAAGVFCVGVIAGCIGSAIYRKWNDQYLRDYYDDSYSRGDDTAERLADELHRRNELLSNQRAEVTSVDTPLRQRPPNIGGIGHPPYEGPNYFSGSEIAEEMKGLMHFHEPKPEDAWPSYPASEAPERAQHLTMNRFATSFKKGHVRPDGDIWVSTGAAVHSGLVRIPTSERRKAEYFGWQFEREGDVPDTVWMARGVTVLRGRWADDNDHQGEKPWGDSSS